MAACAAGPSRLQTYAWLFGYTYVCVCAHIHVKQILRHVYTHVCADRSFTVPQKWGWGMGVGFSGVLAFMYMFIHHGLAHHM